MLEPAWQGDVWFYPRETTTLDETGIATILPAGHAALTTDNETYDPAAMAAAMQDVQLPAIATVTDLDTGRAVTLRVNDRGPRSPKRAIAVTPGVAALLGFAGTDAQVHIVFDPQLTAALRSLVQGKAGDLALTTAPRGSVQRSDLAPLAGTAQEATRDIRGPADVAQAADTPAVTVPTHLPASVTIGEPDPGTLMIDAGAFGSFGAADRRLSQMDDIGARVLRSRTGGVTTYVVRAGPYDSIAEADAALDRLIQDGIIDARIVVDLP